jgi:hypothetical protein
VDESCRVVNIKVFLLSGLSLSVDEICRGLDKGNEKNKRLLKIRHEKSETEDDGKKSVSRPNVG